MENVFLVGIAESSALINFDSAGVFDVFVLA